MKYEKSLDGFRTIAVTLVIIHHWTKRDTMLHNLPFGMIGVAMFFVLSGFLITGILNRSKASGQPLARIFKNFYIRRTLRIFPIYYIFSCILFFSGLLDSKIHFLSCLTYTSNFYIYFLNEWSGMASHLWSLAVEEQFYLIWPLIFLFSTRNAKVLLYLFLAAGILSRMMFTLFDHSHKWSIVLAPTCFDCFAIGGLLAIFTQNADDEQNKRLFKALNIAAVISLIIYLCESFFKTPTIGITERFYVSIISVAIINALYNRQNFILKSVLGFAPIVYLGKISYGLYLFHGTLPLLYYQVQLKMIQYNLYIPFTKHTLLPWLGGYKQIILYAAFLVFITSLSWYLIEKPINNLKNRFQL